MKTKSIKKYRSVGKKASSKKVSKRNKLTAKRSGKSLEKGEEETMCTKYVKEDLDYLADFMELAIKNLKVMALEDPDLEKLKLAKKAMKNYITANKKQTTPRYLKKQMALCEKIYFNPTCDGIDVDGSIIKDGFNTKLDPDDVKQFKRDGATSGCLSSRYIF